MKEIKKQENNPVTEVSSKPRENQRGGKEKEVTNRARTYRATGLVS